ncbi:MAG TPA: hypothetical protein VL574_06085 [Stellaceae bacterium]|nr:hypothetical protein [Stellaceae bacterium]
MISLVFNGCAGWLHPVASTRALGRGVIICESFGYEGLCTQRAMVVFAEMLVEAGLPTLRFHYRGTGDSAEDEAPGQIDRWIDSIGDAVRELRRVTGVEQVTICGLRLGATLAFEAARRHGGVEALALLAPVLSGRNYVRELMLGGSMIGDRKEAAKSEDWIEILGYRLHQEDLARLRQIDLRKTLNGEVAPRILLMSQEEVLPTLDPAVEVRPFQRYDGLQNHTEYVEVPVKAFGDTVAWLADGAPSAGAPSLLKLVEEAVLQVEPGITERPVRFGVGDGCFGVLCGHDEIRHETAVLILNTGVNHHTGNGRASVRLARRLARRGVTSMRVDLGRIGDSLPADAHERVHFYDLGRIADVQAALDVLQRTGHTKVLVTGICAGAYVGLHAAAADRRIAGAVLANLPHFYVGHEDPSVPVWRKPLVLASMLLGRIRSWRRTLPFKVGVLPGAGLITRRRLQAVLRRLRYARLAMRQAAFDLLRAVMPQDAAVGRIDRLVRDMRTRGVELLFAYSRGDLSLLEMRLNFGDRGARLHRNGWAKVEVMEAADHAFTMSDIQNEYAMLIEAQLGLKTGPHPFEVAHAPRPAGQGATRFAQGNTAC